MPDIEQDLEGIRAALAASDASLPGLGDMAARYATACREVNQRLRRCDDLLKKGLRGEAIQQAQLAPALLDEFACLDFPERESWTSYAKERGFTAPPPLQTALAIELNRAFAEADTMEECLRRHRLLALARAPLRRRLEVMWRLAKLDPLNPVWIKDLRVFERHRWTEIDQEITDADRKSDLERIGDLVSEVNSSSWTESPPTSLTKRAKSAWAKLRAANARTKLIPLETRLTEAITAGDKVTAQSLGPEALQLRQEAGLAAGDPVLKRLDLALAWVEEQSSRELRDHAWRRACENLRSGLASDRPFRELDKLHSAVQSQGLGVPTDLDSLHAQARGRQQRRRILLLVVLAIVAVTVPVCIVSVVIAFSRLRERSRPKEQPQAALSETEIKTLKADVRSILQDNCVRCHKATKISGGLRTVLDVSYLSDHEAVKPKGKKYLTPKRPDESALWLRIAEDSMPKGMDALKPEQKEKIRTWIAQGAFALE